MSNTTLATGAGALLIAASIAAPAWAGGTGGVRVSARPIAGEYIVVLDDSVSDVAAAARQMAARHGFEVVYVYRHALKGFAARMPEVSAHGVSRSPRVAYVEENGVAEVAQALPWGLDRINQRNRPLDNVYNMYFATGGGVTVHVIDTGIQANQSDFRTSNSDATSRVSPVGYSGIDDGRGIEDCHGHGTHTAGVAGGLRWGAAPGVTLVSVRVFGCSGRGSVADVMAGVEWVTANQAPAGPDVAILSLAAAPSAALDSAVVSSRAAGITYVVAAGNGGVDACSVSPARVRSLITVAATEGKKANSADRRALFAGGTSSNWGPCVDVFAPGKSIEAAWHREDDPTADGWFAFKSGTSVAAAHVAGVAALYLHWNPTAPPAAVALAITRSATVGKVADTMGSPNRLLFSRLSQHVANSSFESGTSGWTVVGPPGLDIITDSPVHPAHGGSWYAWLAGLASSSVNMLVSQNVVVSTDATSATLTFFARVVSGETTTVSRRDRLYVEVYDPTGTTLLKRLATLSNLDAGGSYKAKSYNLIAYKGQTVKLMFRSLEDDVRPTSFFVDSVAVNVGH